MEQQNQVQWRRDKVQELCSKGYSQIQNISLGLKALGIVHQEEHDDIVYEPGNSL